MFLTPAELKTLTGYTKPTFQIRWLQENGWAHTVDGHGDPVVAVAEKDRQLVGGSKSKARREPDWDALNRKAS